ncbi:MAG: hypothetical protein ACFFFC_00470 [Candidatus Thorarchaeota archaeon]
MDLPWEKLCKLSYARGLRASKGGALLVDVDGAEVWIPQKLIDDKSDVWQEGDVGDLVIPEWFAAEKGLV